MLPINFKDLKKFWLMPKWKKNYTKSKVSVGVWKMNYALIHSSPVAKFAEDLSLTKWDLAKPLP